MMTLYCIPLANKRQGTIVTFTFTFCAIIQNNSELKYVLVFTIIVFIKMQHIKTTIGAHISYSILQKRQCF